MFPARTHIIIMNTLCQYLSKVNPYGLLRQKSCFSYIDDAHATEIISVASCLLAHVLVPLYLDFADTSYWENSFRKLKTLRLTSV